MTHPLLISHFEGEEAILRDRDGRVILWPKNKLPEDVQPGSILYFHICPGEGMIVNNKELAQEILNGILNI